MMMRITTILYRIIILLIALPCFASSTKYSISEINVKSILPTTSYCVINLTTQDTIYKSDSLVCGRTIKAIKNDTLFEISLDNSGKLNLVLKKIKLGDTSSTLISELKFSSFSGKVLADLLSEPIKISIIRIEIVLEKLEDEWQSYNEVKCVRNIDIDSDNLKIIRDDLIKNPYFYTNDNK